MNTLNKTANTNNTPNNTPQPKPAKKNKRLYWIVGSIWLFICVVIGITAYTAANNPVFASILDITPTPVAEVNWAQVNLVKPSTLYMDTSPLTSQNAVQGFELSIEQVTAATQTVLPDSVYSPLYIPTEAPVDPVVVLPADIPTQAPVEPPTQDQAVQGSDAPVPTSTPEPVDPSEPVPGDMPLETPTYPAEIPTSTPEIFEPPVQLAMDVIVDTPTSAYVAPTSSGQQNFPSAGNGVRWIDVDLSNQRVYAYEGDVMLNSFLVSTGTWLTPTVTGQYRIYVKYRSATMSGDDYYLPNVPYVMYFYKGYGLHGTYWHNNFGTPMSHGCVNLHTDDAGWLFNFASVGTLVNVHY